MPGNLAARVVSSAAAVLVAAACTTTSEGTPAPTSSAPGDESVGELYYAWGQFDSDLNEAVLGYKDMRPSPILLGDQSEYEAWHGTLPAAMQPDAEDVTLDEEVAVVGYYSKCMEVSSIQHLGDGEIEFQVEIPPEDEGTLCEAAPLTVELWIINLGELGVDDPDDILLKS